MLRAMLGRSLARDELRAACFHHALKLIAGLGQALGQGSDARNPVGRIGGGNAIDDVALQKEPRGCCAAGDCLEKIIRPRLVHRQRLRELRLHRRGRGSEILDQNRAGVRRIELSQIGDELFAERDGFRTITNDCTQCAKPFARSQLSQRDRGGSAGFGIRCGIAEQLLHRGNQIAQAQRSRDGASGLPVPWRETRARRRQRDDLRIEPAQRQPRVRRSVVAVNDLQIRAAIRVAVQIPCDALRDIISRRRGFGEQVVRPRVAQPHKILRRRIGAREPIMPRDPE